METNTQFWQLLNAVFFLAATQGKEMCYNPEDGCIYEVKDRTQADVILYPIGVGDPTPIFNLEPGTLIFRDDMAARSQKIAFGTLNKALETSSERLDLHSGNENEPQSERDACMSPTTMNAEESAKMRDLIGKGKVDIPRFSPYYTGETAKVSAQIEDLLDKIFAATNYPKTIQKTLDNYYAAKKFAKNGQVWELKQLAERLQGRINKQAAMAAAMNTMTAQSQAKRKMWVSLIIAVVVVFVYIGISQWSKNHDSERTETYSDTEMTATMSPLDAAISEWEAKTGKKIYPKGRECLAKATKGMNKDQIIRVIQQNVK